jgi:hypothetical protein
MTRARRQLIPSWLASGAVLIALLVSGPVHAQPTSHDQPPDPAEGTGAGDMLPSGGDMLPSGEEALAALFAPVVSQLQQTFRPPSSLSPEALRLLSAEVDLTVDADGRIVSYEFVERSGSEAFDRAVERALDPFRVGAQRLRLPFENERAMAVALEQGFRVVFRYPP